jgi:hypothetical protein
MEVEPRWFTRSAAALRFDVDVAGTIPEEVTLRGAFTTLEFVDIKACLSKSLDFLGR